MNIERAALLKKINPQTIFITPNNRLSHQLLDDYYHDNNHLCLDKPRCLSYTNFLEYLYHHVRQQTPHINHPLLLSKSLTRQLWRKIINQTQAHPCNDGLLDAVISAWVTCHNWCVSHTHLSFQALEQTAQFQHWYHLFEKQLQHIHAITPQHLENHLLTYLPMFNEVTSLVWVCFDDYTPAQHALQNTFQTLGFEQLHEDLTQHRGESYKLEAHETEEEYQQLIQWLKQKRFEDKQSIGVVIPNLETESSKLSRLLARHFLAEEINISLGQALAKYPIIAHALQWLQLDLLHITEHQIRLLLSSPYLIKAQHEHIARAQFMQDTRLLQEIATPASLLLKTLPSSVPYLKEALARLTHYPEKMSVHEWVHHFQQRLSMLGFPGDLSLDSVTYQCFQRLNKLFDEFREYSILTDEMTQEEALNSFIDLTQATIFQPKKNQAPIQILGILEASGCIFDSLWVAHMNDLCLPQKGNLSAFIPIELQRKLDMPHANTTRELRFAQQTFQRLQCGSTQSIFSYARLDGDKPCMPSPLLEPLSFMSHQSIAPHAINRKLISYEEPYHIPLHPTEMLTGGTTLLANQAKCPFRAFAAHRLHAKEEHASSEGLSMQERGQLIHAILETIWQTLQTQEKLLHYPTDALDELIQSIVLDKLKPMALNHPLSFPEFLQSIEIQRLTQLTHACLDWDKKRPSFIVEAIEQTATLELAGLTFHVKLDRLDRLSSGKKWVIDYKSRIPTQKPWTQERPREPQLLLYALLDEDIHGLLFIELRHGKITSCGFSEESTKLQGIQTIHTDTTWKSHHDRWFKQLSVLALEFKTGQCIPTPTHATTCSQCDFQNLCRTTSV